MIRHLEIAKNLVKVIDVIEKGGDVLNPCFPLVHILFNDLADGCDDTFFHLFIIHITLNMLFMNFSLNNMTSDDVNN